MKAGLYKIAFVAAALGAPATIAHAQEAGDRTIILIRPSFDRGDVAGMRTEPAYSPRPLQIGSFQVDASLSTIAAYESNVFKRASELDDASITLTPRLRASNNSTGMQMQFGAVGVFRRFATYETENSEEFEFTGAIRSEIAQLGSVFVNTSYARDIEPRSSVGTVDNAAEPVNSNVLNARVGANFALGKLRISPSLNFRDRDYADVDLVGGGTQDLSFRDMQSIGGSLSLGYQISPLVTAFVSGDYDELESTNPRIGADRSAQSYSIMAGVRGELTSLVIAELAAGYRERNYDLTRYRDTSGATFLANVQWFATPLMSFRLQASQRFLDGGRADIAGILSSQFSASAYYDPLRNLRLASTIIYTKNDFRDVDTEADRASVKVQAQYFLNPHIALGAYASVLRQDVSGTPLVRSSTSFTSGIGVVLTP